ncbi:hypothetical protein ILT44_14745 [Microvirga sp. BT689]|uniref:hypothetical protein n=1 Tax=Microvirga arvi TaxID=2778731 RepID=UPI00194FC7EF|nr:hypothetical protein [Microvirga arvi]MBM6581452.1 hypothetical protein [Microvirga arvi]
MPQNLTIQAVTTDGGRQSGNFGVYINENISSGTKIGKLIGIDFPNTNFTIVAENDYGGRFGIIKEGSDYFLIALNGGSVNFDFEDPQFEAFFSQVTFKMYNGTTLAHQVVVDVELNDIVNETPTNTQPTTPVVQGTVATIDENIDGTPTTLVARVQSTDDGVGGTSLRYALVSNPGNLFSIDQATGEIRFTGGRQDYETNANLQVENAGTPQERKFFNVTVKAFESGTGGLESGTTQVKVYLNNVNEAPRAWLSTEGNNQVTIQENRPPNFQIAQLGATDPEGNHPQWSGPFTYRIDITDPTTPYASLYDIINIGTAQAPVWTLVVKGTIDYDSLPAGEKRHTIKVIARDSAGAEGGQYFIINLTNDPSDDQPANTAPTAPSIVNNTVLELTEQQAGAVNVATVQSTDDNVGGTTLQYELVNTINGLFSINQTTGVITFNGTAYNYETGANLQVENAGTMQERKFFEVQVRARESGTGGLTSNVTTVKVYLNDVNEAVSDATYAPNTMNEAAQAGTVVAGSPTVIDPDTAPVNRNFRYIMVDENGNEIQGPSNFAVDAITGVITVGALGLPNVSQPTDVQVRVRIRDHGGDGFSHTEVVTVRVNPADVNSPPTAPTIVNGTLQELTENAAGNVVVARVQSSDDGVGGTTFSYQLANNPGGFFSIDATTGEITFIGGAQNYETNGSLQVENAGTPQERKFFNVTVRAVENGTGGLSSNTTQVKVYLNDLNEAITDATYIVNAMTENAAVGALVGTLQSVVDPDTVATNRNFRYALVDGNGNEIQGLSNFAVNATTGEITVGQLGLPDVNQPTDVQVRVRITDKGGVGFSHTEVVTVQVNPATVPQNQAPSDIVVLSGGTVQELAGIGSTAAVLGTQDPDDTSGFLYSIVNPDGRFAISGNQIVVANGVMLDAEQSASHVVRVRVTDKSGTGRSYEENITINVADLNPETMTVGSASALNDIIKGSKTGNFKDTFFGGAGDDKLWGGYGNDTLWGGTGKDVFVFDGRLGTASTDRRVNYDTIKDYSVKDDSIWLDNDLFKSNKKLYASIKKGTENAPLKMASKFFTVGDKAKQADDYFVYDAKKRVLYYDADGSGSKAAIEMATFTNNKALKAFTVKELFFI